MPDIACKAGKHSKQIWVGAVVVAIVLLCFLFSFCLNFVGLRSGSGTYPSGLWYLQGLMPYRDYVCHITGLSILKSAATIALFGDNYIVLRMMGVFVRIVLALVTFFWLSRLFSVKDACLATIVCATVCCGDCADMIDNPNFDAILFAVGAGLATSFSLNRKRSNRAVAIISMLAGILAGIALLFKQNIGVGVVGMLPVAVIIGFWRMQILARVRYFLPGFFAGSLCIIGAGLLWLNSLGALNQFLTEALIRAPQAKGNYLQHQIEYLGLWWVQALTALAIAVIAESDIVKSAQREDVISVDDRFTTLIPIALLCLGGVALGVVLGRLDLVSVCWVIPKTIQITLIYFAYFISIVCLVGFARRACRWSEREAQFFFMSALSCALIFVISLSSPAYEPMVVPGLGFAAAVLLDSGGRLCRSILYAVAMITIAAVTFGKATTPFLFGGVSEASVRFAKATSSVPRMRGFLLPRDTVTFIDSTVKTINENSGPDDYIFAFPDFSLLYALTNRKCATRSSVLNIDITSDEFAENESMLLIERRPAVLICQKLSEKDLQLMEAWWRQGKRSGFRKLYETCEIMSKQYRHVNRFFLNGTEVNVFVRNK